MKHKQQSLKYEYFEVPKPSDTAATPETAEPKQYTHILESKTTNELAKVSKSIGTPKKFTDSLEMVSNGVHAFLKDFDKLPLDGATHRVLDVLIERLTVTLPYGRNTNIDQINRGRTIVLSLDDYMTECGLKDVKEARKQLNQHIRAITNIRLEWDDEVWEIPDGKKNRALTKKHYNMAIAGLTITDESPEPLRNGKVIFSFSMEFAEYMSHNAQPMPWITEINRLDPRIHKYARIIGRDLFTHYYMNPGRPGANCLGVKTVIEHCLELPKYKDMINSSNRHITRDIIAPVEKALLTLKDKGIIKDFHYCKKNREPIPEDEIERYDYDTWVGWYVEYELPDGYPDQSKRIEARAKRAKAEAKAKATAETKERNRRAQAAAKAAVPEQPKRPRGRPRKTTESGS